MQACRIKQGFNGDGALVSYLENKGDNHETYDPGTCLCVRALKYVRTGEYKTTSSQVRRQDPPRCACLELPAVWGLDELWRLRGVWGI